MTEGIPTVGSFLFDYLYNKGVRHVFGIPGDFALPTIKWLEQSKLDFITMTHEPSVGFAADGYARINGLGVACVTYCVGGLNMLNSIAGAYAEKSPVLVISGGPSPQERVRDPLLHHKVRSFDTQRKIYDEVTCANTILLDPEEAAQEIIRVVETVKRECRPGYIEIPYDVVNMPIRLPTMKNNPPEQSEPNHLRAAIEEVTRVINMADRPVIVADVEMHRFGLTPKVIELAEKFNIPIVSTLLSKSIISETHPLYVGVYSGTFSEPAVQDYVENSDCLIMLGAFVSDVLMGMNANRELDRSKCILANSEKIRVGYHNYSEVVLHEFIEALVEAKLEKRPEFINPNPVPDNPPLTDEERAEPLTAEGFYRVLSLGLNDGTTLVCDTGDSLFGAIGLRTSRSRNFLSDAYYLSMGFGMPAAIGVMAARPENRVITLIGDGAFQMTGIELSTAAKEKMNPIVFVLNNDGYGTQRHIIDGKFNDILQWNYTKMTDMFGYGNGIRVTTKGELETAMHTAMKDRDGLYLIEVVLPRDDCSIPLKRVGQALSEARNG